MAERLEQRKARVLAAVKKLGEGWHTRPEIAEVLGKIRLNPADLVVLDVLCEAGVLESKLEAHPTSAQVNRWLYRIKGG